MVCYSKFNRSSSSEIAIVSEAVSALPQETQHRFDVITTSVSLHRASRVVVLFPAKLVP